MSDRHGETVSRMRFSDFDPENPPEVTHEYEADRLFGVAMQRVVTFAIVLFLLDPEGWVWQYQWWEILLVLYFGFRALVPLVKGAEHAWIDLRTSWPFQ